MKVEGGEAQQLDLRAGEKVREKLRLPTRRTEREETS